NAELVIRDNNRKITVRDPDLLLDSWLDEYNFNRNNIVRGTIATRAGEALLEDTSAVFNKMGIKSAATGLGAAWLYTGFAGFRTATFYIEEYPADKIREKLGFYEGARGANVWLAVPKDEGVFIGTKKMNKVECVHPVRAYLDLKKGQPERADEAAEQLRKKWLTWREK
ncbi:MAG: type IV toxin-antitoxin system AbiEi family antitoxin, partial [Elusimicrobiota bacterium]|nr:type IV toxin-antitoxin system AbiEi family antitoxin [Elusimicrobiota bacterium]